MAVNNQPKDDAKAMTDEYVKGATIASLAEKYNHTEHEVEAIVTSPAPEPTTTAPAEDKKGK